MLQFLDILFYPIHIGFILYSLFGWAWRRQRRMHLIFIGVIAACWFGIGLVSGYGIGYCPLTDWHWQVKGQLGQRGLPMSFIKHLWDSVLPVAISPAAVNTLTFTAFYATVAITVYLNFFQRMPRDEKAADD